MKTRRTEWAAATVAAIALICFAWLAVEMSSGRAAAFDAAWRGRIHSAASPELTMVVQAVTMLGAGTTLTGVVGGAALIMARAGRIDRAIVTLVALGGSALMNITLKNQFARVRPEAFFGDIHNSYSFPSGHALLSLSCYGVLALFATSHMPLVPRTALRIAAALLIFCIGLTRVYLGVHYPTDVIAGFLAGAVWLASLASIYTRVTAKKP